jgi:hypothetical protein
MPAGNQQSFLNAAPPGFVRGYGAIRRQIVEGIVGYRRRRMRRIPQNTPQARSV